MGGDDDDCGNVPATKEQVLSLPFVSRRINSRDLTQNAAGALWRKQAGNGCGEQEFAAYWNAVSKLPDHGPDDTDSEYGTDDDDGPMIDRHGASPQAEDAAPPEGGGNGGEDCPILGLRDDGPNAGGDFEENKSLGEDDEADDEVDWLKSEVANLRTRIEYKRQLVYKGQDKNGALLREIRDLQAKLSRKSAQLEVAMVATAREDHRGDGLGSSRSLAPTAQDSPSRLLRRLGRAGPP